MTVAGNHRGTFLVRLSSQVSGSLYVGLVSLGVTLFLGRYLGPDGFGRYTLALTLASLYFVFQDGGYKTLILREVVRPTPDLDQHTEHILRAATGHVLLTTALGMILSVIIFQEPWIRWSAATACLCFGVQAVVGFVSSGLIAGSRFHREALWRMLVRTTGAVGLVATVFLAENPAAIFLGWTFGILLALLFSPVQVARPSFSAAVRPLWLRSSMAFVVVELGTLIYNRIDILMFDFFGLPVSDVGQYAAAYRLLDGIVMLAAPVGILFFKSFREIQDRSTLTHRAVKGALGLLPVGLILLLVAFFLGDWGIEALYGQAYGKAGELLPYLFAALVFILPNGILTQAHISAGIESFYAVVVALCALANVGLNWLLIPYYGIFGAAWATLGAEALLCALLLVGLVRNGKICKVAL